MVTRLYTPLIPIPLPSAAANEQAEHTGNALQKEADKKRSQDRKQPMEEATTPATNRPLAAATPRTAQQQAWLNRQAASPQTASSSPLGSVSGAVAPVVGLSPAPTLAPPVRLSAQASITATAPASVTVSSVRSASPTYPLSPPPPPLVASVPAVDELPPLQTVAQHTQAQTITGQAILNDFGQTADLLGAPEGLKQQLQQYMGIVRAESAQPRPDAGLIQSVLQRAATGLDGHVTQTLGQPSTVVTEWVQALLQQPIDWQTTDASAAPGVSQDWAASANTGKLLDKPAKAQVAHALTEYQQASQAKDWPQARLAVESALSHLQPYQAPELKGKFYHLQGKVSATQGDWEGAITATHQALEQHQQAGAQGKLPPLWHELGRYHQQLGQPDQAKAAFEAGLSVTQQLPPASQAQASAYQGQLWQGLGQLALENRQPQVAAEAFGKALQISPDLGFKQATALQLAATHRQNQQPALAESAYKQALTFAKQPDQVSQYRQTLAQLTSLYVEQGQTQKAQRLMPYLARLS